MQHGLFYVPLSELLTSRAAKSRRHADILFTVKFYNETALTDWYNTYYIDTYKLINAFSDLKLHREQKDLKVLH